MKSLIKYIIILYKYTLSGFLKSCRFYPSCSEYALQALEHYSLPKSLMKITWRILRCNPFSDGGFDEIVAVSQNQKNIKDEQN